MTCSPEELAQIADGLWVNARIRFAMRSTILPSGSRAAPNGNITTNGLF